MKKLLFLFLCVVVFNCTINAQSTNSYPENPPRFELTLSHTNSTTDFLLILDSQTGIIKCIVLKIHGGSFYVNDEDLTNGTSTKNGRFRFLKTETISNLIDTEDGRCWGINLDTKEEKTTFRLISDSMLKK